MIVVDTREQKNQFILEYFEKNNIEFKEEKLDVGDYQLNENTSFVIDRKANIEELIQNVIHDHARLVREIKRASDSGIHLLFLVQSEEVKSLDDLDAWENPRIKWSPKATTGQTLKKILNTMIDEYGMQVIFCDKSHFATTLIWLLRSHNRNEGARS